MESENERVKLKKRKEKKIYIFAMHLIKLNVFTRILQDTPTYKTTKLPILYNINHDMKGNVMGKMRNSIRGGNFLKKIKFPCFLQQNSLSSTFYYFQANQTPKKFRFFSLSCIFYT